MKINILGYILISFVFLIAYRILQESEYLNLKCIISQVDGNKYCVRERSKLTLAVDLLANIESNPLNNISDKMNDNQETKKENKDEGFSFFKVDEKNENNETKSEIDPKNDNIILNNESKADLYKPIHQLTPQEFYRF